MRRLKRAGWRIKLAYWRMTGRVTCPQWPCKRCERAGRGGWRSRELWHWRRRDRWITIWVAVRAVLCSAGALILIVWAASLTDGAW